MNHILDILSYILIIPCHGVGKVYKMSMQTYFRMNSKLDQIDRMVKRGGGRGRGSGGSNGALETLAQESFDILTLIPTYIENTKEAIGVLSEETKVNYILLNVQLYFWKNNV